MKINYSTHISFSQLILIFISLLSITLINYSQSVEQWFLSITLQSVIVIGDLSVSFAIMANTNFTHGIAVFFLFRIALQIFCDSISTSQVLLPALLCYSIFKVITIIFVKINRLDRFDIKDVSKRDVVVDCEQKKRSINILLLSSSLIILFSCYLSNVVPLGSFLVYLTSMAGLVFQIYVMNKAQDVLFKLIANSLPLNLYLYILTTTILGKILHDDYTKFIVPTIILLIPSFFLIRIFIGSKSAKFHKGDLILFSMTYIFKGDDGDRSYRNNKNIERTLRILDGVSRKIVLFVYFLSAITAFYEDQYTYLFVSIVLIMNYPMQQEEQWKPVAYLKDKFKLGWKLKWKFIIPIIMLIITYIGKENNMRQQLFSTINHCSTINNFQIAFLSLIFIGLVISIFSSIQIQQTIFRIVQLVCPLILVVWVIWLHCVDKKLVALGLYVLTYSIESIRDGRQGRRKGSKRQ